MVGLLECSWWNAVEDYGKTYAAGATDKEFDRRYLSFIRLPPRTRPKTTTQLILSSSGHPGFGELCQFCRIHPVDVHVLHLEIGRMFSKVTVGE